MAHQAPTVVVPSTARLGLSSDLVACLQSADNPIMQQLGSYLSAMDAETVDLRRRLAASEEKARLNVITRSVVFLLSTTNVGRWHMCLTHLFFRITERAIRVYFKNLDWDAATPEERASILSSRRTPEVWQLQDLHSQYARLRLPDSSR